MYSLVLVLPTLSQWYGQFGYDSQLGKCDYLPPSHQENIHPRQLFLSVAFIVPLLLIGLSYLTIWRTTLRDGSIYLYFQHFSKFFQNFCVNHPILGPTHS